ncbi:acyltransferase [Rhodanobacter sp. IGA1.0]|uniref:Acyltransferase n=1 Tax=Rhodanobacter sp. IGA1.0 TaxID=3158582 RepID=A0AAU7QLZ1_9GAMM
MLMRYLQTKGVGWRAQLKFPVSMLGVRRNISLANGVVADRFSSLLCDRFGEIRIGRDSYVGRFAVLKTYRGFIKVGANTSINAFCFINGCGGVRIGDDVRIAAHCSIISSNHVFSDPKKPIRTQGLIALGVTIEDDVWLGTGARILDGVTIGKGAVVAAGAVVVRDVAPYSVVGGVPARLIKMRGSE